VLRVMRERKLIQRRRPLGRRRRPGFFCVERPDQLWHLDMTSVWVAEHGWVYLMAAIDCCTREIVAWHLETRCRAKEAIGLIERAATDVTLLRGDRTGAPDDPSCLVALAAWRGVPVVVVAQHRDRRAHGRSVMGPAGFRKARRGMALAAELGLPLVTLIDTPGAEMSVIASVARQRVSRCQATISRVQQSIAAIR